MGRKKLVYESLESRDLLSLWFPFPTGSTANIVSVRISRGDLYITGDGADNQIEITQTLDINTLEPVLTITPLGNTQLRGDVDQNTGQVTRPVYDDVIVCMKGGDDLVKFVGAVVFNGDFGAQQVIPGAPLIPDDLCVDLGNGNDQFGFAGAAVGGSATIKAGAGQDTAIFLVSEIGNNLKVTMDSGIDVFGLGGTTVVGNATIDTGWGNDFAAVSLSTIGGRLTLLMNKGDDTAAVTDDLLAIEIQFLDFVLENFNFIPEPADAEEALRLLAGDVLVDNLGLFFPDFEALIGTLDPVEDRVGSFCIDGGPGVDIIVRDPNVPYRRFEFVINTILPPP